MVKQMINKEDRVVEKAAKILANKKLEIGKDISQTFCCKYNPDGTYIYGGTLLESDLKKLIAEWINFNKSHGTTDWKNINKFIKEGDSEGLSEFFLKKAKPREDETIGGIEVRTLGGEVQTLVGQSALPILPTGAIDIRRTKTEKYGISGVESVGLGPASLGERRLATTARIERGGFVAGWEKYGLRLPFMGQPGKAKLGATSGIFSLGIAAPTVRKGMWIKPYAGLDIAGVYYIGWDPFIGGFTRGINWVGLAIGLGMKRVGSAFQVGKETGRREGSFWKGVWAGIKNLLNPWEWVKDAWQVGVVQPTRMLINSIWRFFIPVKKPKDPNKVFSQKEIEKIVNDIDENIRNGKPDVAYDKIRYYLQHKNLPPWLRGYLEAAKETIEMQSAYIGLPWFWFKDGKFFVNKKNYARNSIRKNIDNAVKRVEELSKKPQLTKEEREELEYYISYLAPKISGVYNREIEEFVEDSPCAYNKDRVYNAVRKGFGIISAGIKKDITKLDELAGKEKLSDEEMRFAYDRLSFYGNLSKYFVRTPLERSMQDQFERSDLLKVTNYASAVYLYQSDDLDKIFVGYNCLISMEEERAKPKGFENLKTNYEEKIRAKLKSDEGIAWANRYMYEISKTIINNAPAALKAIEDKKTMDETIYLVENAANMLTIIETEGLIDENKLDKKIRNEYKKAKVILNGCKITLYLMDWASRGITYNDLNEETKRKIESTKNEVEKLAKSGEKSARGILEVLNKYYKQVCT
ncbi:MAG: hypothetical protein QXL47_00445 [Candidatus Anstonellales archaeon]